MVRSNCQEVDIGSEAVAQGLAVPYREWLRLLSQWLESYRRTRSKGPQKHRFEISRMYVFNNLANHVVDLKLFIGSTFSNDNYAEKGCQKNLSR